MSKFKEMLQEFVEAIYPASVEKQRKLFTDIMHASHTNLTYPTNIKCTPEAYRAIYEFLNHVPPFSYEQMQKTIQHAKDIQRKNEAISVLIECVNVLLLFTPCCESCDHIECERLEDLKRAEKEFKVASLFGNEE